MKNEVGLRHIWFAFSITKINCALFINNVSSTFHVALNYITVNITATTYIPDNVISANRVIAAIYITV